MTEHHSYHRYLKVFALSVPIIIALVALFNYFIDPYRVYDSPKIDGINVNKPAVASHLRMSKAYQVRHLKPAAIILGTSRAEFGLDPDHTGWSHQPTYNLNLSGGNIYEMLRYFQHAQAINHLEQLVLALDFFQFNINKGNSPDFDENRLAINRLGDQQSQGMSRHDLFATLISLDAVRSSVDTLSSQYRKPTYLSNGLIDPETTKRGKLLHIIGYRQVFINNEARYFNKTYNNFAFVSKDGETSVFNHYRTLLAAAYREGIDFRMLIGPSHARQFETIAASGLWPAFEEWKLSLVRINEDEARKSNSTEFPLWDFSGYNAYTTEEVPPLGDIETKMRWYWESSHYNTALGDLVLDRVLNHVVPGKIVAENFGVQITNKNIESHLLAVRQDRERWRETHPEDVAEIEGLVE